MLSLPGEEYCNLRLTRATTLITSLTDDNTCTRKHNQWKIDFECAVNG